MFTDLKASFVSIHDGRAVGRVRFLHGSLQSRDDSLPGGARRAGLLVLLEDEGGLAVAADDARGVARHGMPFLQGFRFDCKIYFGSERFTVGLS